MSIQFKTLFTVSAVCLFLLACKKQDAITIPPTLGHFTDQSSGSYFVTGPTVTYKIPVGLTTVSDRSRTIKFSISSPTGAVPGTQYSVSGQTIVIPAGKAVDSIEVKGVFSQYASGRKDTLIFTILENDGIEPADYNKTFKLLVQGPCFEGNIVLAELLGDYTHTNEDFGGAYGPYPTKILSVTSLTATTGTIKVANIFDAGWNPIVFTLDWTDPANRKLTLVQQSGIGNAGTISSTYAGQDITVRPLAGQNGTFSYCSQTLTLKMQLGVTGLGFFGTPYTVNMAR